MELTQALANELFEYSDGVLYWKVARCNNRIKAGDRAGRLSWQGYWETGINGKKYGNHRLIFLMKNGYLPSLIDHIDGNPKNNLIENLREATYEQNNHNAKLHIGNTSGVKGVHWHKRSKKWLARVGVSGRRTHVGYYSTIEEASKAVQEAREKLHGEFANHGVH
jgi:hypothetical protein